MKIKVYKIYRLICFLTNMSYIGQTIDLHKRLRNHLHSKHFIGQALRKYEPENFKIEILWITINKETANVIEIAAIDFYNSLYPNGYNLTPGGENPPSNKGKKRPKHSKKMKGNKNAKGCDCNKLIKRNKENNPMKNKIPKLKWKITNKKRHIERIEKELEQKDNA